MRIASIHAAACHLQYQLTAFVDRSLPPPLEVRCLGVLDATGSLWTLAFCYGATKCYGRILIKGLQYGLNQGSLIFSAGGVLSMNRAFQFSVSLV